MKIQSIQQIWAKNPKLQHLGLRSTEKEVDKAFRDAGLFNEYNYVKDEHFEFVLREIDSLEKALRFIGELNDDRVQYELKHQKYWKNKNTYIAQDTYTVCQKTWELNSWLKNKFWHKSDRISTPFANARRTYCSCHNLGDFSVRKE